MKKHMKLGVVAIVAVLALTAGIAATALALSPEGEAASVDGPRQVFVSKVADILGLEDEQVADAFRQASQQMREEAQQQRLQEAVENGLITEEEAGMIQEWWQDRPEAIQQLGPPGGFNLLGPPEGFGHQMHSGLMH
ncbi:MAG: hypothetical protein KAW89_07180 [Armatimonadetes bacterium]|nr:hypothetical protein [Armatimonadota bacterium]